MTGTKIQINLLKHEALVFFEWLALLDNNDIVKIDDAEQQVIWKVEGQLEGKISEVFASDYHDILSEAKRQVLEGEQRTKEE